MLLLMLLALLELDLFEMSEAEDAAACADAASDPELMNFDPKGL